MHEDFYTSLHRHGRDKTHLQMLLDGRYVGSPKLLPLFEHLYNKHFAALTSSYIIPKKIHQIWLGQDLPSQYASWIETWASLAGWEYRLWTDADASKILKHNSGLYQLAKNYGEKSDILRLEILYQEGGLYVDVDYKCLNSDFFDRLHRTLSFYAGFEPLEHRWLGVSNSLMGSAPGHPLLRKSIFDLRAQFFAEEHQWAIVKTGPKFMTNVIEEFIQESPKAQLCIFPSSYFCPASGNDIKQKSYPVFSESAAFHYWTGSWVQLVGSN